jgi:hypothetical protein
MWRFIGMLVFIFSLISCSSALKIDPVRVEYRNPTLHYFVENHGQDDRRLDQVIAEELRHYGLKVSNGFKSERPAQFDILVVYEDRWQWDMSVYLIHMRIDLRDPKTNVLLGTGSSYQTSLARDDERNIIKNIITGMFGSDSTR